MQCQFKPEVNLVNLFRAFKYISRYVSHKEIESSFLILEMEDDETFSPCCHVIVDAHYFSDTFSAHSWLRKQHFDQTPQGLLFVLLVSSTLQSKENSWDHFIVDSVAAAGKAVIYLPLVGCLVSKQSWPQWSLFRWTLFPQKHFEQIIVMLVDSPLVLIIILTKVFHILFGCISSPYCM